MLAKRMLASIVVLILTVGGVGALSGTASAAPSPVVPPRKAAQIVIGLIDATGTLGVQCGMSKIAEKLKAGSVAADAVKASLRISGAKSSCKGVVELLKGIAVIVGFTDFKKPVFISLAQSQKNKWWGGGIVKTCSVNLRVGATERIAKNFKASFTCH